MSLVGGYKLPGVSSSATTPTTISDFVGFQLSGNTNSAGIACCLYVWNGTNWNPMTQP